MKAELTPGGAQTLSKMPDRFPGTYPRSLSCGFGTVVWDSLGRGYVDWICSLGAVSLGYGVESVDDAVREQVRCGPIFSLPDVALETSVARKLCDTIPCAESVRFLKTGSEATEAAIRTARAHTGREIIVQCGYHSWHSWYAATRGDAPGVPRAMRDLVRSFKYNDLDSLDKILGQAYPAACGGGRYAQHTAAIMVEPTLFEAPAPGFLEGLRERADRIGALLIFDEMVTGFRWHRGGYQAVCGVTPDLATFGKGLGNGYPIAALVGREEPMRWARLASGTFGGDCIGLAAAEAVLDFYDAHDVCGHMRAIGQALMDQYNALARAHAAPTRMEGQPYHPRIVWDEVPSFEAESDGETLMRNTSNRHRASLFFQEVADAAGRTAPLFHPDGINVMYMHTLKDVDLTMRACDAAMGRVVDAIAVGRHAVAGALRGSPISPHAPWRVTQ